MRAVWVTWVASASSRCASSATPPKGLVQSFAFRNYADPQHFCHCRGMCSAWVPGIRAGKPSSGGRTFSSGSVLASGASVLPLYYVTAVTARVKRRRFRIVTGVASATAQPARKQVRTVIRIAVGATPNTSARRRPAHWRRRPAWSPPPRPTAPRSVRAATPVG